MSEPYIILEKSNGIARITLNNPSRLNAFTGNMREDLAAAVEDVGCDSAIRVITITGAGGAFCAGGNVKEFVDGSTIEKVKALGPTEMSPMHRVMMLLNKAEKPVIAAVNGVAAGGGAGLALSCDIRLASENARFGFVFTKRGIFPDWGSVYLLPRIVGYTKACELLYSGDVISADECLKIGLVNQVVAHDALEETVLEMAEKFARNAPVAMALTKRGLRGGEQWDLPTFIEYETLAMNKTFETEDANEGFNAFLEKRVPKFEGR